MVNQFFELFYLNREGKVHRNNKEAWFSLFNVKKKFYNNGNLLEKKEFKKVVLKDKINNFQKKQGYKLAYRKATI